ncbi:diacylglycerol kinase family protein [Candidatus Parcubacteria bacterium]|nr:MAG: diacylglycerol kinase family protein [Candidatus Parcubacteria bacterium]
MLKRIVKSFKYAWLGVKLVFKTEKSFRLEILIAFLVIAFAWYRGLEEISWVLLLLVIALVLALEIFNSAIERLVDMLAPKTHSFAKEIKDLLAGMVLLVCFFAAAIGFIIFL